MIKRAMFPVGQSGCSIDSMCTGNQQNLEADTPCRCMRSWIHCSGLTPDVSCLMWFRSWYRLPAWQSDNWQGTWFRFMNEASDSIHRKSASRLSSFAPKAFFGPPKCWDFFPIFWVFSASNMECGNFIGIIHKFYSNQFTFFIAKI